MGGMRIGAGGSRTGWVARGSELGDHGPDGWYADQSWGITDRMGGTRIDAGGYGLDGWRAGTRIGAARPAKRIGGTRIGAGGAQGRM